MDSLTSVVDVVKGLSLTGDRVGSRYKNRVMVAI